MAVIRVALEDENGRPLRELDAPLSSRLIPDSRDRAFRCLGFIDEYGDTVFNGMQMPDLITELERVAENADAEQRERIDKLLAMARACKVGSHMYLKFYGD